VKVTVSGSFHRFMKEVTEDVEEFKGLGMTVMSPKEPYVVGEMGDFIFVASDLVKSIHLVQNRHLDSITASNFLWLVNPGGYVGLSAAMEIGYAVAFQVPVFTLFEPKDMTLKQYVTVVGSLKEAIGEAILISGRRSILEGSA